jgi:hypothetical protein
MRESRLRIDSDRNGVGDLCDGVSSFTVTAGNQTAFRNVFDTTTLACSATNQFDLAFFPTASPGGTASFTAFTHEGQELYIFNYPMGITDDDLGGANVQGPFSSTHGWPFLPGLKYTSIPGVTGATGTSSYDHETSHVVRYMHGTCSRRIPLAPLFEKLAATLESVFICQTLDQGLGFVHVTRRSFEAQPHFRGETGLALINEAPTEMGVSFSAEFDAREPSTNAGITVGMNPGYAIKVNADGGIDVYNINDAANVFLVNGPAGVKDRIKDALINTVPAAIAAQFNDALVVPLPSMLATSCDPTTPATSARGCYDAAVAALGLGCLAGNTSACSAQSAIEPRNFVCPTSSGMCAFKPVVHGLNVLPDSIELVFAPNPANANQPIDALYRVALADLSGSDPGVCEDHVLEAHIDADVPSLQLGESEVQMGSEDVPPIPCSELAGF